MTSCHRFLAALGTPCGGTTYLANALQTAGLKVLKEGMGEDGTVCGQFMWGIKLHKPEDYTFDHIVRYIRHPLLCAKTLPAYVSNKPEWPWHVPNAAGRRDLAMVQALRYWVLTHEKIPGESPTIRVGPSFADDWKKLASTLGVSPVPPQVDDVYLCSKVQRFDEKVPSWDQWRRKDPGFADRAAALVERYDLEP